MMRSNGMNLVLIVSLSLLEYSDAFSFCRVQSPFVPISPSKHVRSVSINVASIDYSMSGFINPMNVVESVWEESNRLKQAAEQEDINSQWDKLIRMVVQSENTIQQQKQNESQDLVEAWDRLTAMNSPLLQQDQSFVNNNNELKTPIVQVDHLLVGNNNELTTPIVQVDHLLVRNNDDLTTPVVLQDQLFACNNDDLTSHIVQQDKLLVCNNDESTPVSVQQDQPVVYNNDMQYRILPTDNDVLSSTQDDVEVFSLPQIDLGALFEKAYCTFKEVRELEASGKYSPDAISFRVCEVSPFFEKICISVATECGRIVAKIFGGAEPYNWVD